jgi:hypothetical protein
VSIDLDQDHLHEANSSWCSIEQHKIALGLEYPAPLLSVADKVIG